MTKISLGDVLDYYKKLLGLTPKEEEEEIPEHWRNIDSEEDISMPPYLFEPELGEVKQKAVTPTPVFKERKKRSFIFPSLGIPWLKLKQVTAVLLLIVNLITLSGYLVNTSYILAALYYIPSTIISLDYLVKTRKLQEPKWYILEDVEEDID